MKQATNEVSEDLLLLVW